MFRSIIDSENKKRSNEINTDKQQLARLATYSHKKDKIGEKRSSGPQTLQQDASHDMKFQNSDQPTIGTAIHQSRTLSLTNQILNNSNNRLQTFGGAERSIDSESTDRAEEEEEDDIGAAEKRSQDSK